MSLKKKIILGLIFLFLIIFTLVGFCSYYVGRLGQKSENILKDNYETLVYARNMFSGLDDMKTAMAMEMSDSSHVTTGSDYYSRLFESGRSLFESNLKLERGNITEIHEQNYVDSLNSEYEAFQKLCSQARSGAMEKSAYLHDFLPSSQRLKQLIDSIYDVNMQAVVQKSRSAKFSAARFINSMAVIGTICLLLAFAYLWYFPFYISTTMNYLSERMKKLLKSTGTAIDIKTNDETVVILHGINLLENKFGLSQDAKDNE